MFNFFDEIKNKFVGNGDILTDFNIINMSGKILYIEGHCGVVTINSNLVIIKIKKGRVVIDGENFVLKELSENTLLLQGKIIKMEMF